MPLRRPGRARKTRDDEETAVVPMEGWDAETLVAEVYPAATFGWLGCYREGSYVDDPRQRREADFAAVEACSVTVGDHRDTYLDSTTRGSRRRRLAGRRPTAHDRTAAGPRRRLTAVDDAVAAVSLGRSPAYISFRPNYRLCLTTRAASKASVRTSTATRWSPRSYARTLAQTIRRNSRGVRLRPARLVPPIIVAAAIDRVVLNSGEPGLLTDAGLFRPAKSLAKPPESPSSSDSSSSRPSRSHPVGSAFRIEIPLAIERPKNTAGPPKRDVRPPPASLAVFLCEPPDRRDDVDTQQRHQPAGVVSEHGVPPMYEVVATVGGIAVILSPTRRSWRSSRSHRSRSSASPAASSLRGLSRGIARFARRCRGSTRGWRTTSAARRSSRRSTGTTSAQASDRPEPEYHDEMVQRSASAGPSSAACGIDRHRVRADTVRRRDGLLRMKISERRCLARAFTAFFLYSRRLYSPIRRVGTSADKYQLAKSSAERVFGLLGQEPEVTDPEDTYEPDSIDGRVEFDDVTFGYGDEPPVVRDVSLDVPTAQPSASPGRPGPANQPC